MGFAILLLTNDKWGEADVPIHWYYDIRVLIIL